eukprot:tig00021137_g18973.t1
MPATSAETAAAPSDAPPDAPTPRPLLTVAFLNVESLAGIPRRIWLTGWLKRTKVDVLGIVDHRLNPKQIAALTQRIESSWRVLIPPAAELKPNVWSRGTGFLVRKAIPALPERYSLSPVPCFAPRRRRRRVPLRRRALPRLRQSHPRGNSFVCSNDYAFLCLVGTLSRAGSRGYPALPEAPLPSPRSPVALPRRPAGPSGAPPPLGPAAPGRVRPSPSPRFATPRPARAEAAAFHPAGNVHLWPTF